MSLFCNMNMFMNNCFSCMGNPFGNFSFFNSGFNFPIFNFGSFNNYNNFSNLWNNSSFANFGNLSIFSNFSNSWNNNNFSNFNNISNFNNYPMPDFGSFWCGDSFSYSKSSSKKVKTSDKTTSSSGLGQKVLDKAMSYVGNVNSDAEGVRLFSPAGSSSNRGWCADFATYCASKAVGSKYPKSMITGAPGVMRDQAKANKCWVDGWSSSAKPGDIIIVPGKGVSGLHVAIIKSIDGNGKLTAVSGNSGNKVKESTYNTSSVKGFVSIEKLA